MLTYNLTIKCKFYKLVQIKNKNISVMMAEKKLKTTTSHKRRLHKS